MAVWVAHNTRTARHFFQSEPDRDEMSDTQITIPAFKIAIAECIDAVKARDWETAWDKHFEAEGINAAFDVEVHSAEVSSRRRETLAGLASLIERRQAAVAQTTDSGRRQIRFRMNFS